MRKISSYLYPNRVELLADLAGFTTEYTNVYQRTVKIYKGVDNVIEFDIKNADQKRIGLIDTTDPAYTAPITDIMLNVMDSQGNALPNSPYTVTPDTTLKGIATAVIPAGDLTNLAHQFLRYSVTATKDTNNIPLYADSRFGAVGTIEVVGNAMPVGQEAKTDIYKTFTAEIDLKGVPTYHSSAIPAKYYEAIPSTQFDFEVDLIGFTGSVWIETSNMSTINLEAFKKSDYVRSETFDNYTGTWSPATVDTAGKDYQYFRVSYTTPTIIGIGASFLVTLSNNSYNVSIRAGGTGYAIGSKIKVLGSLLGGADGVNDLIVIVTGNEGSASLVPNGPNSYMIGSVNAIEWQGTAVAGSATFIVSGTNITGTVDKVTVTRA